MKLKGVTEVRNKEEVTNKRIEEEERRSGEEMCVCVCMCFHTSTASERKEERREEVRVLLAGHQRKRSAGTARHRKHR